MKNSFIVKILYFLVATYFSLFSLHAQEREEILSYRSDIQVHEDASLIVTETIQVRALNQQINHGIYRDFPVVYQDRYGKKYKVGFEIENVLLNGIPEQYITESIQADFGSVWGTRVRIGRKEVTLQPGIYTYTIKYKTSRQLGFFAEHDELYWNVTGNKWRFPILHAEAHVKLPNAVPLDALKLDAYTGVEGSKAQNYAAGIKEKNSEIQFITKSRLASNEGLTIVVAWPKGFVRAPSDSEKLQYFINDNLGFLLALGILAVVLFYYVSSWMLVGKDPAKGTIIPLFKAPAGMSPADLSYLVNMKFTNHSFTSAIINMAVKGYLKIVKDDLGYELKRTGIPESDLDQDEKNIAEALFGRVDNISVEQGNHSKFSEAKNSLKDSLKSKHNGKNFLNNFKYLTIGIILSACAIISVLIFQPAGLAGAAIFMMVWLSIWSIGVVTLTILVITAWRGVFAARQGLLGSSASAISITLFSIPFIAGEIFGLFILYRSAGIAATLIMIFAVLINATFAKLLKAPTIQGRKLLDQIEGFKMYLTTAEEDRLAAQYPPTKTPELFEEFLPYALALGVEQLWAQKFASVISSTEQGTNATGAYTPLWYSGTGFNNLSSFSNSFSSSFSSALSSSSSAPGSSSGGGGGGSSGGGGGGGGGGGW